MFENVDNICTYTHTHGRQRPTYTMIQITNEPKGSGELKKRSLKTLNLSDLGPRSMNDLDL